MPIPTKERLAQVLHAVGEFAMEAQARLGSYDDYESESATPIADLVTELERRGLRDLANRARDGEWDGTKEEAEAWYQREGKYLLQRNRRVH